jgi:hypothetical protein
MTMYVYLIFDKNTRLTKIGKSVNPEKRLHALKISAPHLELIFFSDQFEEKELHSHFSRKRISREWFKLTKDDIIKITGRTDNIPSELLYSSGSKRQTPIHYSKITEVIVKGFIYPSVDNLYMYADEFYLDNKKLSKIYNNGSFSVVINGSKKSIKKLAKEAIETDIRFNSDLGLKNLSIKKM